VIDWKNFSDALHEIGFDGVFSLETNVKPNGLDPEELLRKRQELSKTARRLAGG
jgi:sugar phosphate isomerase/epimerase